VSFGLEESSHAIRLVFREPAFIKVTAWEDLKAFTVFLALKYLPVV
jgi:hypothetical protein